MAGRPSEHFRAEHARIVVVLERVRVAVGTLERAGPEAQGGIAREVVRALEVEILAHDQWEDRVLYPIVDKHAGSGAYAFTATLRHEHKVIARWSAELAEHLARSHLEVVAFVRRADNLLGLILAHLEVEEEVLLKVLDATMSISQLTREVAARGR